MRHSGPRPKPWFSGPLAGLLLLGALFVAPLAVASATPQMQVSVGRAVRDGGWALYRLRIVATGDPVAAIVPATTRAAELSVNGTVVAWTGLGVLSPRPLGAATNALLLSGLAPTDRVEIRVQGGGAAPRIVGNVDVFSGTMRAGLASGLYFGILITILIFQLVAVFSMSNATLLWYCLWITSAIGFEFIRDDFLGWTPKANVVAISAMALVAQVGNVGFVSAYLRLPRQAPLLFALLLAVTFASDVLPFIVGAARHDGIDLVTLYLSATIGIAIAIAIALVRRRSGFQPASFLAFGLLGSLMAMASSFLLEETGIGSALSARWSAEAGFVFDFLVFSLGLVYRAHFTQRERQNVEAELREASLAAGHDPLTGLLNRRGLEAWLSEPGREAGTVLFIDIDGFKGVNDVGGHAAGDDMLGVVARITRHAVREGDATARFGGDEFVLVLAGRFDATIANDVIARISSAVGSLLPLGPNSATRIGVSIGKASLEGVPFGEALRLADADAYRVKAEHHALARKPRRHFAT